MISFLICSKSKSPFCFIEKESCLLVGSLTFKSEKHCEEKDFEDSSCLPKKLFLLDVAFRDFIECLDALNFVAIRIFLAKSINLNINSY